MSLLYHFTPYHSVSNILNTGISKGIVIKTDALGMLEFVPGFQWLTANKDFEQSWCDPKFTSLKYSRTEVRLTISIPDKANHNLFNWLSYSEDNKNEMYDILNMYGDPEKWFIYKGIIDVKWIKAIHFNPEYLKKRKHHEQPTIKRPCHNSGRGNRGVFQVD